MTLGLPGFFLVLGYSTDLLPLVGALPTRSEGIFLSAGFTGHGMPRIPGCSAAIVKLALAHVEGREQEAARVEFENVLPEPYLLTQKRLDSEENLILGYMGQQKGEVVELSPAEEGAVRAHI